jgi:hypothetical protein
VKLAFIRHHAWANAVPVARICTAAKSDCLHPLALRSSVILSPNNTFGVAIVYRFRKFIHTKIACEMDILGILKKLADILGTTVDFLINGNTEEKAKASLVDAEVIRYFKKVDTLPQEDKTALLRVIGGFILDVKTKQAYAS